MARIPKYQQDQLASSLVGTPGIDTSGQTIASSISNMVQDTAQFSLGAQKQAAAMGRQQQAGWESMGASALNDVQKELNARMAVQRALEKQLQANQDETDTATKSAALKMRLSDRYSQIKVANAENPEMAPKLWQQQGQQDITDFLANTPMNDNVRSNVNKVGLAELTQGYESLNRDFVPSQRKDNAEADLNANALQLINASSNGGNWEDFQKQIGILDASAPAYYNRYGKKDGDVRMAKVKEGMASNLIASMLNQYPDIAKNWLETGALNPYLDGTKRDKFINEAQTEMRASKIDADRLQAHKDELTAVQIMSIAESANTIKDSPKLITEARRQLQVIEDQELQKPPEQRNPNTLKLLQSQKNQLDSQLNHVAEETRRQATEARTEQRAVTAEAKAAKVEKEKAAKEAAIAKYESPEATKGRADVKAAFDLLTNDAQTIGTTEEVQRVIRARTALQKAQAGGYLVYPGAKDSVTDSYLGLLQEKMQRIVDATLAGGKATGKKIIKPELTVTEAEQYYKALIRPAPPVVHQALNKEANPVKSGQIDDAFLADVHAGVDAFTRKKGRAPTVAEVENIRSIVRASQLTGRNNQ